MAVTSGDGLGLAVRSKGIGALTGMLRCSRWELLWVNHIELQKKNLLGAERRHALGVIIQ